MTRVVVTKKRIDHMAPGKGDWPVKKQVAAIIMVALLWGCAGTQDAKPPAAGGKKCGSPAPFREQGLRPPQMLRR